METYVPILKKSALFRGFRDAELAAALPKLAVHTKKYPKGSFVFYAGDQIRAISIVLSGAVHVVQEDFWGNRNILTRISIGEMFGEGFACAPGVPTEVDAVVAASAEILFLDTDRFIHPENRAQEQLAANLLSIIAAKNVFLTKKIRVMSQRTTRQKLMAFLSAEAQRRGKSSFSIAFNRQQLADFLSVDRSAMSSELSRMKLEGLLDFNKEKFTLYSMPE